MQKLIFLCFVCPACCIRGESGYGRCDMAVIPKDAGKRGVLMEFKAARESEELMTKAEEALREMEDRKYDSLFEARVFRMYGNMALHSVENRSKCFQCSENHS